MDVKKEEVISLQELEVLTCPKCKMQFVLFEITKGELEGGICSALWSRGDCNYCPYCGYNNKEE